LSSNNYGAARRTSFPRVTRGARWNWCRRASFSPEMSTPRIAARRLALLLFLPACHTWRPVELSPVPQFEPTSHVRVERTDHPSITFTRARVVADSLVGVPAVASSPTSVALADVTRAKVRRLSGKRTTLLIIGVAGGLGAAAALVAKEMEKGVGLGPICTPGSRSYIC